MRLRRLAAGLIALLIVPLGATTQASPATATDGRITTQWYTQPSGLDALKARGLNGAGVKIAVIDGAPDTSVPELAGADITVKYPCKAKVLKRSESHGTAVLSILASPDFGWAPKAKYTVYNIPVDYKHLPKKCASAGTFSMPYLIDQALNDGADLISISTVATSQGYALDYALARAAVAGVPVVVSAGNTGMSQPLMMAACNVVVTVGAVGKNGQRAKFSNYGTGLTVMAPGTAFTVRDYGTDGRLSLIHDGAGTSFAAPMVTGALALAKQTWPNANGNQLIGSLIATADRSGDAWQEQTGWGTLDATKLVATDPSSQSTENPLIGKGGDKPDAQEVADYRDGLVDPGEYLVNDPTYVYRGNDKVICLTWKPHPCELGTSPRYQSASPSAAPSSPSAPAPATPAMPSGGDALLPVLIGGGTVLVIIGAIVGFVVLRRRP